MKRLITLTILIIGTISCYESSGFRETFNHCDDEPMIFENTYSHIDSERSDSLPWHEHRWSDKMSLVHVDSNIFTLECFGLTLETIRDGCDFIIIEQELDLSGIVAKISGNGRHSKRVDKGSGPPGLILKFDINYLYDGVESNCSFVGTYYY